MGPKVLRHAWDAAAGPPRPGRTVLGYSLMLMCGLLGWGGALALSGPTSFGLSLTLALLPLPFAGLVVLSLDRIEPEPTRNLMLAFVWGATVAALLAGVVNVVGISFTERALGSGEGLGAYASVGAPIVEEILKGAVLVIFLITRHQELDGPTDGIIYAGMVGLGFAFTENIEYYISAYDVGGDKALAGTFLIRGVFCPLLHPLFTAMIGLAVGYAALRSRRGERVLLVLAGLLVAMILHGLWNGTLSFAPEAVLGTYALIMAPALIALLIVTRRDSARILALRLRLLPQVTPAGMLTDQLAQLLAYPSALRATRRQLTRDGHTDAAEALEVYQRAATELVLAHHRLERGVADVAWVERRRAVLLPILDTARRRLVLPHQPTWR
ncbi:MAG: PrsW family intramembrane metalloprotease [Sporichthyaceae bacterium]